MREYGVSRPTYRVATTDAAVGLAADIITDATLGPIDRVVITCETANVRVAIGTPTQGAAGLGKLLYPGDVLTVPGNSDCRALRWISAANGVPGALQITPRYDRGG